MQIKQGSVVKSIAGHDSDRFYAVVRLEGDFAYIADGKVRKLESPKKKRLKHLAPTKSEVDLNETATNNKLKIALSEFNSEGPVTKEVI